MDLCVGKYESSVVSLEVRHEIVNLLSNSADDSEALSQ